MSIDTWILYTALYTQHFQWFVWHAPCWAIDFEIPPDYLPRKCLHAGISCDTKSDKANDKAEKATLWARAILQMRLLPCYLVTPPRPLDILASWRPRKLSHPSYWFSSTTRLSLHQIHFFPFKQNCTIRNVAWITWIWLLWYGETWICVCAGTRSHIFDSRICQQPALHFVFTHPRTLTG